MAGNQWSLSEQAVEYPGAMLEYEQLLSRYYIKGSMTDGITCCSFKMSTYGRLPVFTHMKEWRIMIIGSGDS